jgi:hypothetical protein
LEGAVQVRFAVVAPVAVAVILVGMPGTVAATVDVELEFAETAP